MNKETKKRKRIKTSYDVVSDALVRKIEECERLKAEIHPKAYNEAIEAVLQKKFIIEGPHGPIPVVRVDEIESLKLDPNQALAF